MSQSQTSLLPVKLLRRRPRRRTVLYAQRHDTVHNIVVVLLERLHRLLSAHARLSHDQLDVLRLQASVIDLLSIVLLFFSLLAGVPLDGLALVALCAVVMAGVLVGGLCGELLGGRGLGLGVEVFDLGLTEDAVVAECVSNL